MRDQARQNQLSPSQRLLANAVAGQVRAVKHHSDQGASLQFPLRVDNVVSLPASSVQAERQARRQDNIAGHQADPLCLLIYSLCQYRHVQKVSACCPLVQARSPRSPAKDNFDLGAPSQHHISQAQVRKANGRPG